MVFYVSFFLYLILKVSLIIDIENYSDVEFSLLSDSLYDSEVL